MCQTSSHGERKKESKKEIKEKKERKKERKRERLMVFHATFNNISVISWWSV